MFKTSYDQEALLAAGKKLRRLRIETVGGRKERPARTVGSIVDREGDLKGDDLFWAWLIHKAMNYYAASRSPAYIVDENGHKGWTIP